VTVGRRLLDRLRPGRPDPADDVRERARALAEQHRWFEAARCWRDLTDRAGDDATGHRELARTAGNVVDWGGSLAGSPARFVPLGRLATEHPDDAVATAPLATARAAMERAAELRPESVAWAAPLAELRELAGDLAGAVAAYEQAVAGAETSTSAWVARSRHLWRFELERVRHRLGCSDVDDPLLDATLTPVGEVPSDEPVGVVRPRFTHQGLNVGGTVTDATVASVRLELDGTVLRHVNLGAGDPRVFDVLLGREVLDLAPTDAVLQVVADDGRPLLVRGAATAVRVHLPRGEGTLLDLLAAGRTLDKKGGLAPTADEVAARQDEHLQLYGRVRDAFRELLDRELFVLYGTLLGIERQGDLIPGDDDVDCGYVASAGDPAAVKLEALGFIEALVRAGFTVSLNRRGRLLRVHDERIADASVHLDVHPIWFEGPDLYLHNHHRFPAEVGDVLPTATRQLRGIPIQVPNRPVVLLEQLYGPGWRVPDPGYVDDATGTAPEVMDRLGEALVTPAEIRELSDRLGDPATREPGQGRFVALALQPLYPLEDLIG
jgi:hypothetical protein